MDQIWVTHTVDPATFWFISADDDQLCKTKESQLTEFMDRQEQTSEQLTPQIGSLVAVRHPETSKWQRGEVQKWNSPSRHESLIFLLDHGIVTCAPINNIRMLPREFMSEYFATRLHLHGLEIVPSNNALLVEGSNAKWQDEAYALVTSMLVKAQSYCLGKASHLVDKTVFGDLCLSINNSLVSMTDILVENGFAVKSKKVEDKEWSYATDPYEGSMGDGKGFPNPMKGEVIKLQTLHDGSVEELCGFGTTSKNRLSTHSSPTMYTRAADTVVMKYLPAGCTLPQMESAVTRKQGQKQSKNRTQTSLPVGQMSGKAESKSAIVSIKQETMTSDSSISSADSSPMAVTNVAQSKRTLMLKQKLMQAQSDLTKSDIQPSNTIAGAPLSIDQSPIVKEHKSEVLADAFTVSPAPTGVSRRSLKLHEQLSKAKAENQPTKMKYEPPSEIQKDLPKDTSRKTCTSSYDNLQRNPFKFKNLYHHMKMIDEQ